MASDYTQSQGVVEINSMQNQQHENQPATAQEVARPGQTTIASQNNGFSSIPMATNSGHRLLNDVNLIRNRRINFNYKTKKQMELVCEEKVSKYKLEEVHFSLPSSVKSTFIMTFSPDGQRVASTHGDHRIYICDLNTGKLLDTLEGHPKTPWCLAWHPSNREILASGCLAGEVRVWDLKSKACESWITENNTIITSLDFHPKERVLVIATANDIHFWDWSESEPFAKTTTTHDREKVKFVVFDSSGTKLITGISNSPRYAGCSSDSLQNRIIDGYMLPGSQLQTENMTQNSEITNSPGNGTLNPNASFNEHDASHERQFNSSTSVNNTNRSSNNNNNNSNRNHNNIDQDINYRNTLTLSRVAFLYRQLEALEDSMRNTSFAPYINPRPIGSTIDCSEFGNSTTNSDHGQSSQRETEQSGSTLGNQTSDSNVNSQSESPPTHHSPSHNGVDFITTRTSNTFEPCLVTFDESLEQLQLPPLLVDGQTVNLATIIERFPIDISHQLHYVMQFESINQVNQNFIRISKLMSSARLYRQVVQQILSSNSGSSHHQPNQILTAQSVSPRSSRSSANLPIVLRNFSIGDFVEPNNLVRGNRPSDPIMAIQFRNSARNVPLVTICKIDLLAARAVCILRSQLLVEQASASTLSSAYSEQHSIDNHSNEHVDTLDRSKSNSGSQQRSNVQDDNNVAGASFCPILSQLHSSLTMINHAPLTTSNVYTHITSLRVLVDKLLKALSSMLNSPADGRRLTELIHNTAFSLTGRRWSVPLGPTYDEIRLDVIHTLCIVDLTLHFARQIQLLQMQRISILARIGESRRSASSLVQETSRPSDDGASSSTNNKRESNEAEQTCSSAGPSTSASRNLKAVKRKDAGELQSDTKRRRNDLSVNLGQTKGNVDAEMIEVNSTTSPIPNSANTNNSALNNLSHNLSSSLAETMPTDRLLIWNNPQNQIEQSLQRFLVATASNMSNSHILVRIYHRLHGVASLPLQAASVIDHSVEQLNPPYESRRRALSQDNSINSPDSIEASIPQVASGSVRGRMRPPALHVNFIPTGSGYPTSGGVALETWQRHPHLHVYQTRGTGQHLWFNQWTIPLPVNNSNYRLQCWDFSLSTIPNIKDSQINVITHKCRIHNDSSVDISTDGNLIACLVPRDDVATCLPSFDLKIFSLKSYDFGTCYYRLPHGPNAISVSLSPSGNYAVVGLASHKFISNDPNDDDLTIAKVFKLNGKNSYGFIRDIKIKRDESSLSLNAIRWMSRGIVYNVGPQHHQRYQATRMRNVVGS